MFKVSDPEKHSMEAIFDRKAILVAGLSDDAEVVYSLQMRPVAYVSSGALYTYGSHHLGYFDKGFFRDRRGRAVAFVRKHSGGPITAIPPIPPVPPCKRPSNTPVPGRRFVCKRQRKHTVDRPSPQPASKRGGGQKGNPSPVNVARLHRFTKQILRQRNP